MNDGGAIQPSGLTGTGQLLRLAARRDRVMLPVWVLAIAATVVATVSSYRDLYPNQADLDAVAQTVGSSPALLAVTGPAFGLNSIGGLTVWKVGGFIAVLAAVLNILLVVRHTRGEEESGRLELLRSSVAGRHSALAAALVIAVIGDVAIAVLVALACVGYGLAAPGALALGLATGLSGVVFGAVAALAAQLTRAARTASAISFGLLAVTFLLRAVGDSTGPGWLSWLSPLGWAEQVRPYSGERWWVLLLPLLAGPVLAAGAVLLSGRRDLGEALLSERPGPAEGRLATPLGLAWRLHRVTALIWLAGFALSGLLFGTITPGIGDMVTDNQNLLDALAKLGGTQGVTDAFVGAMIRITGLIAAIHAVQSVLRIRAEETGGLVEPVLATIVGRFRWAGTQLGLALSESCLLLAGFGLGLGIGSALADPGGATASSILDPLAGSMLQLPAAWVVGGVAVALFGLLPRWTPVAWGVLGVVLFISWFGPLIQLDQGVLDVSPFTHVPSIPGDAMSWPPVLLLTALAIVLAAAGLAGWRRRDVG